MLRDRLSWCHCKSLHFNQSSFATTRFHVDSCVNDNNGMIYWNRESVSNAILTFVSLVGCYSLVLIADQFIDYSVFYLSSFSILIGSAITAGVFFSMILGHWYLNVIALPISLLKKSTITLWIALLIRLLWDIFYFATTQHT